jgi:hypothetical protein
VPVTVYAPAAGEAELRFALTGPGDDPSTDLIEELRNGDAKAYASNGADMVAMPLTLDGEGRLVGTWTQSLNPGYNPVTWYVTIISGALVGNYALDVALTGGNAVDTATVAVVAPEQHGEQPPGAGEDTTAPVVTITVVGTLSSTATFTLSADEDNVTYQCRLVKDDVPGEWGPCDESGKSYTGLTAGIYAFHVKATDAAGNVSGMYSKTWVVSPTPDEAAAVPDTKLVSGPSDGSWLLAHSATYVVSSTEPGSAYVVTLDGKYVGTSASPTVRVNGLRAGTHRIGIRALANGLADQTPLVRTVSVPRGVATLRHTNAWNLRHGSAHLFGKYAQTRRQGQEFRIRSSAIKRVVLVASEGVGQGKVRVFLNGRALRTIDLSASANRAGVLIPVATFGSTRHGVITVKVVSSGKVVRLEGIGIAAR